MASHNLSANEIEAMVSDLESGTFNHPLNSISDQVKSLLHTLRDDPAAQVFVRRLHAVERRQEYAGRLAEYRSFRDGGRLDLYERKLEAFATGRAATDARDPNLSAELDAFAEAKA